MTEAEGYIDTNAHLRARVAVLEQELAAAQARTIRMVELMRTLEDGDWNVELFQELCALANAAMSDDAILREMIEAARVEEREAIFCSVEQTWYAQGLDVRGASVSDFLAAIRARNADKPTGLSERVMTIFAQMQAVSHGRARKG